MFKTIRLIESQDSHDCDNGCGGRAHSFMFRTYGGADGEKDFGVLASVGCFHTAYTDYEDALADLCKEYNIDWDSLPWGSSSWEDADGEIHHEAYVMRDQIPKFFEDMGVEFEYENVDLAIDYSFDDDDLYNDWEFADEEGDD